MGEAKRPGAMANSRECFEFGPVFPQMGNPFDALYAAKEGWCPRLFLGQSEDAFAVNVFAPAGNLKHLPVMVG